MRDRRRAGRMAWGGRETAACGIAGGPEGWLGAGGNAAAFGERSRGRRASAARPRARRREASVLALRELEALAGAGAAVLLALDRARVARHEAGLLEHRPELRIVVAERAADAVSDRAGLAGEPAALRVHEHVELAHLIDELQRLDEDHLRRLAAEVLVHRAAVDRDVARPGRDADARDGLLAAADRDCQRRHLRLPYWSASGFCAACGCFSPA